MYLVELGHFFCVMHTLEIVINSLYSVLVACLNCARDNRMGQGTGVDWWPSLVSP